MYRLLSKIGGGNLKIIFVSEKIEISLLKDQLNSLSQNNKVTIQFLPKLHTFDSDRDAINY